METRTVEQVLIYYLVLNPMRDRTEAANIVAISYEKQKLIDWYNSEKADKPYEDNNWSKSFKKEGSLEWYNPVNFGYDAENFEPNHFGHGIRSEWIINDGNIEYLNHKVIY